MVAVSSERHSRITLSVRLENAAMLLEKSELWTFYLFESNRPHSLMSCVFSGTQQRVALKELTNECDRIDSSFFKSQLLKMLHCTFFIALIEDINTLELQILPSSERAKFIRSIHVYHMFNKSLFSSQDRCSTYSPLMTESYSTCFSAQSNPYKRVTLRRRLRHLIYYVFSSF